MDLASGWLSARTREASSQLRLALDLRFAGVALLPGEPRPDPVGLEAARGRTGAGFPVVSWQGLLAEEQPEGDPTESGPSPGPEDLAATDSVLTLARGFGGRILVVDAGAGAGPQVAERSRRLLHRLAAGEDAGSCQEAVEELRQLAAPDRERRLEDLARFLFALRRAAPGLVLALLPAVSPAGILDPASLGLLLEDPALAGVGYWHDCARIQARAALGLEDPGAWLDAHAARMLGVSLQDWGAGRWGMMPGEGLVDWPLLRDYLPGSARRVLVLAPAYPDGATREARSALEGHGIR